MKISEKVIHQTVVLFPIKVLNYCSSKGDFSAEFDLDYAPTLLARDYKGFNNYGCAAVIVGKRNV